MNAARAAIGLAALTLALASGGCLNLDFMFFPGVQLDAYELPDNHIPDDQLDQVALDSGGGETIHGVWALQDDPRATVVYSHGNYQNLDPYWDRVMLLWDEGYQVFIYDYPSYGMSTGEPTEDAIERSAAAAHHHAVERLRADAGAERTAAQLGVVHYGFSLGSVAAIYMAAEIEEPAALLTEAALASAEAFVSDSTHIGLPASLLVTMEIDNIGRIPAVDAPKLLMHGDHDDYIAPYFSEMLFDAADAPKELWLVPGGEHGNMVCGGYSDDCIDAPDDSFQAWRDRTNGFLDRWVAPLP